MTTTTKPLTVSLTGDEIRDRDAVKSSERIAKKTDLIPGGVTFTLTLDGLDDAKTVLDLLKHGGVFAQTVMAVLISTAVEALAEAGEISSDDVQGAVAHSVIHSALSRFAGEN